MAQKCNKTGKWVARWYVDGKRKSQSGFSSKKNAELYEAQQRVKKESRLLGKEPIEEAALEEIFSRYLDWARQNKTAKSSARDQSVIRNLTAFFQEKSVRFFRELNQSTPIQYVDWRKKQITVCAKTPSKRTMNLELITMRRIFAWAQQNGVTSSMPFTSIPTFKQARPGVPRYLTVEELGRIEKLAKNQELYQAIAVLSRTGMRSGELCGLTADNVNLEKKTITLNPHENKTGLIRIIPLNPMALEIVGDAVKDAQKSGRRVLFCNSDGTAQTPDNLLRRFKTVLRQAKKEGINVDGVNVHTLRKTFISHAIMAGMDHVKVMAIVGHQEWTTVKRYLSLSPGYLSGQDDFLPY